MWTFLALFATIAIAIYYYIQSSYSYWTKRGIKGPKPKFLFGNIGTPLTSTRHLCDFVNEIYNEYKEYRYVGVYKFMKPTLIVRDLELLKNILVKDCDHFEETEFDIDPDVDPLGAKHLFALSGQKWKTLRGQLTPCFTPAKMKPLFPLVEDCSKKFSKYMNNLIEEDKGTCVDAKDISVRFTTENVVLCAFGLEANAFEDKGSEFLRVTKDIGDVSLATGLKLYVLQMLPSLNKILRVRFFNEKNTEFLVNTVSQTLKYREENNIVRNDFLDMMSHLKNSKENPFTDFDVTAHAVGFLGDGIETSGVTLSFVLYNLATHPEVQDKLSEEIKKTIANNGGLTYDLLVNMPYLDTVINESVRISSAVLFNSRRCTKNYKFPPQKGDGEDLIVEKGTSIIIPTTALHEDPEHFPNAQSFDPDRFSSENKDQISKVAYMPFGIGPRLCLGMRFGLFQVKMGVATLVKDFVIRLNDKTQRPIRVDPNGFVRNAAGGLWLDFKKR